MREKTSMRTESSTRSFFFCSGTGTVVFQKLNIVKGGVGRLPSPQHFSQKSTRANGEGSTGPFGSGFSALGPAGNSAAGWWGWSQRAAQQMVFGGSSEPQPKQVPVALPTFQECCAFMVVIGGS